MIDPEPRLTQDALDAAIDAVLTDGAAVYDGVFDDEELPNWTCCGSQNG